MLDVVLEYHISSERSRILHRADAGAPGRAHLDGAASDHAGRRRARVPVRRQPGPRAARPALAPGRVRFVKLGFQHILDGFDHLLFVLCLVIPFRRFKPLVAIVTSFTVAHSITLIASALGLAPDALWFPPLIEMLIALRSCTWRSRTSSAPDWSGAG